MTDAEWGLLVMGAEYHAMVGELIEQLGPDQAALEVLAALGLLTAEPGA